MERKSMDELLCEYTSDMRSKVEGLPFNMHPSDVADFMGICLSSAYRLIKTPDFPVLKMLNINRIIIPKANFLKWYFERCE